MSLRKTGPDSLQVVLEHTPAEVVLTISPCQPDVLEVRALCILSQTDHVCAHYEAYAV